jgi:CheY-like chemotaxis protein
VRRALEEFRPIAREKGVVLSSFESTPGIQVRGDSSRLAQAIGNLLSNAVKFTPAGKTVSVRMIPAVEHVDVVVRDEGVGIAPEFLPRLFQRFTQADASSTRQQSGLGLGLSIVRELLDLQGGQAFAHSDGPNLGATFTIRMPRLSTEQAPLATVGSEAESRPTPFSLTGARLLVVDDEADVRATLADMLLSCGATVTTVGSVREALQAFRVDTPDAVVSDIAMPELDGYALIARIRAQSGPAARTPALALTAYASIADRDRAIAAGFDRYLAKPAEVGRLSRAIAELLRDRVLQPTKT